jgi:hypothetical protein
MPKKLIICVHGIGDHKADFHKTWAEILNSNHDSAKFKVEGLFWDDLQDQLYDKFIEIDPQIREILEKTFLENAFKYLSDPANSTLLNFIKENVFDALSYLFFSEFRNAILWPKCIIRLNEILLKYKSYQPLFIGHSLGSVLLTHITWFIRQTTGNMNYSGFFLLGSPLGMRSPLAVLPDFLNLLAEIGHHPSRLEALNIWAAEWWHHQKNRLHIIINELDPIAWDAKVDCGSAGEIDIIPVRQGLSEKDLKQIETQNPGAVKRFQSGSKKVQDIIINHNVENYLNSNLFKNSFDTLL